MASSSSWVGVCVNNIWGAEILKLGKPCSSWWSWPSCTSHKEPRLLPRPPSKESDLVLNQNQIGYDDYAKDNLVHLVHGIDRDTLPKKFKPPGTSGCWLPRPVFSPLHCCPPGVCKIFLKTYFVFFFQLKRIHENQNFRFQMQRYWWLPALQRGPPSCIAIRGSESCQQKSETLSED